MPFAAEETDALEETDDVTVDISVVPLISTVVVSDAIFSPVAVLWLAGNVTVVVLTDEKPVDVVAGCVDNATETLSVDVVVVTAPSCVDDPDEDCDPVAGVPV